MAMQGMIYVSQRSVKNFAPIVPSLTSLFSSSPLDGAGFFILGDIGFYQRQPLKHSGYRGDYNVRINRRPLLLVLKPLTPPQEPLVDGSSLRAADYNFQQILLNYTTRNGEACQLPNLSPLTPPPRPPESLWLERVAPVWSAPRAGTDAFVLEFRINYPPQDVRFVVTSTSPVRSLSSPPAGTAPVPGKNSNGRGSSTSPFSSRCWLC